MPLTPDDLILVTGGHGFIGSHIVLRLLKDGYRVRLVDVRPACALPIPRHDRLEVIVGNLCEPTICRQVLRGVGVVLHLAATMGGMGTIHSENDFIIYRTNQTMTTLLLSEAASPKFDVKLFFYASSACVYPEHLQSDARHDVSLAESSAWNNPPPKPQGLYGFEKFVTELLLNQVDSDMSVRIARFHNVYGPGGSWSAGKEKVPAALCRKLLASQMLGIPAPTVEMWGSGNQRRSFLYISDCVEAVMRLLHSDYQEPINIGSDRAVSIKDLAYIAGHAVYHHDIDITFILAEDKPVGVASRNSDNTLVGSILNWEPQVSLEDGMADTAEWIRAQMAAEIQELSDDEKGVVLEMLQTSAVVKLSDEALTFALLLPITSRGGVSPGDCLENLRRFAISLLRTTSGERHDIGSAVQFRFRIYLAIDRDDEYLRGNTSELDQTNRAQDALALMGITDVVTIICDYPKGHVCHHWRELARKAWKDKCDYFVLLGDDVVLHDTHWMSQAHVEFVMLQATRSPTHPHGIGCVAFTDISFPGMPTFPIIHRTHLDIFNGEVVPEDFINQDGDPYLFQLYRRWGVSKMFPYRIENGCGGSNEARYDKVHAKQWTFDVLDKGIKTIESWLQRHDAAITSQITLDVVIPCYRVLLPILDAILCLHSSTTCSVMFIIIIDNPLSPFIPVIESKYQYRSDIRIRTNTQNLGAAASRNRGLSESAADWILFLDDDVQPSESILFEAEKVIRRYPDAAGFVGNSRFPLAESIFTTAVHLAGVTYFWDIATKIVNDLPWGVTANLITRRKRGIEFDLDFPKTGGGEDIDFCLKQRAASIAQGGEGFRPAPEVIVTHPWWHEGQRSYRRFFMWSVGDGGLIKKHPEHTYWDFAPNSAELLLVCVLVASLGIVACFFTLQNHWSVAAFTVRSIISVFAANILHDFWRHFWRHSDRAAQINTSLRGGLWILAVLESTIVRIISEVGRTAGLLQRGEVTLLGKRFDWFTGRSGEGPRAEERSNSVERFSVFLGLMTVCLFL
ncbi:hypothetical protein HGRIS_009171 [Hohenbuehelia grisea]|uniref:Glycosyltransferase family 2 protein n=1 Tax=Hohenbuehelia grisea TaxID=104357 RepID=A0ABR3J0R9_9AGAR